MSTVDNLKSILIRQKELLTNLETEITSIEASDLVIENQKLKSELEKSQISLEKERNDNQKILEENKNLRNALYEQFYNEKVEILNAMQRKMDVYYKSNIEGEMNRLDSLERTINKQINDIAKVLREYRISIEDNMFKELDELKTKLYIKVTAARAELARKTGAFSDDRNSALENLKQERVTEDQIKERVKQNNIESFIGLNIINKLGVLLLVIGVIAASQYTYFKLPDMLKSIFAFVIGIALLVTGEFLNRKKPNVFSLGITSGGVAVLYVALAVSFFGFKVLDMYPALGLSVLITLVAFVLSQRYNSQTIAAFAMIGGYLPIFSIAGSKTMVYGAMVYFVILNILALSISVNKKWTITAYIGFVLNVTGTLYISYIMFRSRLWNASFKIEDLITILYIVFAFITYTLIPVLGTIRKSLSFKNTDIVLLALNTMISSLMLYAVFYIVDLSDFTGALAIVFAAVYLALGKFIETLMTKEQKARALFYITGLTFTILVVPFQFGRVWLSLGWLVEGVVLLTYGIFKELKEFKKAGTIISVLCLAAFMVFDFINPYSIYFVYKYLAITAGSIIILIALVKKKDLASTEKLLFKYFVVLNAWIFSLYIVGDKLGVYMSKSVELKGINTDYLISAAMILVCLFAAYSIPRIKALCDNVMKTMSVIIYIIALFSIFILNLNTPVRGFLNEVPLSVSFFGTVELLVITILAILAMRDLLLNLMLEKKLGIEWYPLLLSSYFVVILTQNLITQYDLAFNNAVISIIYIVTALAWITFGFIKRYAFIRRFGLGLSILSVAKLFIIDLSFLSQGYKITSYFIFGVTLIAISFVYQYFSKRIDNVCEVMPDDKKNFS